MLVVTDEYLVLIRFGVPFLFVGTLLSIIAVEWLAEVPFGVLVKLAGHRHIAVEAEHVFLPIVAVLTLCSRTVFVERRKTMIRETVLLAPVFVLSIEFVLSSERTDGSLGLRRSPNDTATFHIAGRAPISVCAPLRKVVSMRLWHQARASLSVSAASSSAGVSSHSQSDGDGVSGRAMDCSLPS